MAFSGFSSPSLSIPPLLQPLLKPGIDRRDLQYSYDPGVFQTQKGKLLVPRYENPPTPTPEMISQACQGHLTSFFGQGRIFRASDLIGTVSASNAKISLDSTYDFQTRPLSPSLSIAENAKSLRNLFYLAVRKDELPSYHFWTGPNDPDPVTSGETTDWNAVLEESKPAGWGDIQKVEKQQHRDSDVNNPFDMSLGKNIGHSQTANSSTSIERSGVAWGQPSRPSYFHLPGLDPKPLKADEISPKGIAPNKEAINTTEQRRTSILPSGNPAFPSPDFGKPLLQTDTSSRKGSLLDVKAKPGKDEPRDSSVLLRCERGGMILSDFSKAAFRSLTSWLVQNEDNDTDVGGSLSFVDILKPGQKESEAVALKSGIRFDRTYAREIHPFLGIRGCHFRIRSDAYDEDSPWDNGRDGTIKITRVDVGYCYVNAIGSWDDVEQHNKNNEIFESALEFLFGQDHSQPTQLTLEIPPEHEPFDIDRSLASLLPLELVEILEDISEQSVSSGDLEAVPHRYAAEIFVHETGKEFVHPLTKALEARKEKEKGEKEAALLEQQEAKEAGDGNETNQQPGQQRSSIIPPMTVFEYNPGSGGSSVRAKVRTQSEIGDLERRLKIAEDRVHRLSQTVPVEDIVAERDSLKSAVDGNEKTIGLLILENNNLESRAQDAENQVKRLEERVEDLENQRFQLRSQQRDLEKESQRLTRERDGLQNKVNDLEDQAFQETEDRALLTSTVVNLEEQARRLTEEREELQRRVNQFEESTAGQDQRIEGTNQQPAVQFTEQNDAPIAMPLPQDAVAAAADSPSGSAGPKKLLYCIICLKSVDKLDQNGKAKHADKCNTPVSSFQYLTTQEAKALRAGRKAGKNVEAHTTSERRGANTENVGNIEAEEGPSEPAQDLTNNSQNSRQASQRRGDRKRKRSAEDEPEQAPETATKRQKRKAKAVTKPDEGATVVKEITTRPTRTRAQAPAPPPEMISPDGDSPPPTIGATLKRKSKPDTDPDEEVLVANTARARSTRTRGPVSRPPARMIEPDGDSSPSEIGPAMKRKSSDSDLDDHRMPQRKRSKK